MDLFPGIDIRGGQCVRLVRGDFDRETVYRADPLAVAKELAAEGAPWLHVVDLDAARTGAPENRELVTAIAAAVDVPVQTGGGVRDAAAASVLLDAGVARVVIGTAAMENPGLVSELAGRFPRQVAVGLDVRDREVAVRGWAEGSGVSLADALATFEDAGAAAVIVTDIGRDGTLSGPNLELLGDVLASTSVDVIASGGVGSLDDVRALAALEQGGRRLAGVIVGKALYEGRFTVAEGVVACALSA